MKSIDPNFSVKYLATGGIKTGDSKMLIIKENKDEE